MFTRLQSGSFTWPIDTYHLPFNKDWNVKLKASNHQLWTSNTPIFVILSLSQPNPIL